MDYLFDKILKDNFSGSGKILLQVQEALLAYGRSKKKINTEKLLRQLDVLEDHFPHFALLFHFLHALRRFLGKEIFTDIASFTTFIRQYQTFYEHVQQKAAENLLRYVPLSGKNILLHSNSSAIHQLFGVLAAKNISPVVWQTVSSPANEGWKQAETLKGFGFEVHVFHEDAVSKFMDGIDLAVFGADLLWEESFLNKVGTLPITLVFRHFNKPVYVLAESRKQISPTKTGRRRFQLFLKENAKPPGELSLTPQTDIAIHNYYFETIPLDLVTQVFLEERSF